MLALIVLVSGHCYDFTYYISKKWEQHVRNDAGQQSLGEEALKEAWNEFTQIRTLWNAKGMPEEIPVEGLAS